jgi:hypothetical protein
MAMQCLAGSLNKPFLNMCMSNISAFLLHLRSDVMNEMIDVYYAIHINFLSDIGHKRKPHTPW